ncbi:MAG TPA: sigma 54-interacting transcriptional regulator, partial [Thermoanaerobaculia bacterium]|nr:sigma 54-interacting transcriptional regulator [Thermoanaerobaculia bacterium]
YELVRRLAASDLPVLVAGETGTGKELVAQAVHAWSPRAGKPFVALNCAAIQDTLVESELFGYERGAFSGALASKPGLLETARGGTVLLDEIGDLAASGQAKLLRALETGRITRVGDVRERPIDIRIVAATNRDLEADVAQGRFRQDLLFRLNTVNLHLPPLRDRVEDVEALAESFLERHAKRYRKPVERFDEGALSALRRYRWPGNVRELDHAVERGVLMARGPAIGEDDLFLDRGPDAGVVLPGGSPRLEEMTLEEAEKVMIERALDRHDGSVTEAAKTLGLSRSALYRRLEKYEIET